jgi:hypothetical protein
VPYSSRSHPWPRRHPFHGGRRAFGGDQWFNLGAETVHQVVDDTAWADEVLAFLRWAPTPDELLIPSLVLNAAARLDVVNDRRRYVRFTRGERSPATLTTADVPDIVASGAFFARKFSAAAGEPGGVLDSLDAATAG